MLKWRVRITKILQAKKIYINKNSLCQCAIYFDKSMSLSVFFFYPITSKLTTSRDICALEEMHYLNNLITSSDYL